jgi:hypothetical protein
MQLKTALMGVIFLTAMMVAVPAHTLLSAQQNPNAPGLQKKYRATRPIAVDAATAEDATRRRHDRRPPGRLQRRHPGAAQ